MDQTICCLAVAGKALLINPRLPVEMVSLPENVTLVVADSLVRAEKAAATKLLFNTRVVECRLAAIILSAVVGIRNFAEINTIFDAETAFRNHLDSPVVDRNEILDKFLEFSECTLSKECYSVEMIDEYMSLLTGEVFRIREYFKESLPAMEVLQAVGAFKIRSRCRHVIGEARRVLLFQEYCSPNGNGCLASLGALLNDSHDSLRDLYECSCKELDDLQKYALGIGK